MQRALDVQPTPKRIVVLGGGLAGLSAAYQLVQAGHDVTVLEAKPVAGGKVSTIREPFEAGQHAEAGAMFVPGHHTLTMGYIGLLDLPLVQITSKPTDVMAYIRGVRIDHPGQPDAISAAEREHGYWGLWQEYVLNVVHNEIGDPSQPDWPSAKVLAYDDVTFAEFLKNQGASPTALEVLKLGYFDLFGDGMYAVSALTILRDLANTMNGVPPQVKHGFAPERDFPAPLVSKLQLSTGKTETEAEAVRQSFTIEGGNDRLPLGLAQTPELRGRIVYDVPVVRVEEASDGLRVVTSTDGTVRTWDAQRVICTIPFSVLRGIELKVPLSAEKRAAITGLRYTSVTREYVQTRSRIWEKAGVPGTVVTDLPIMYINDQTITQPGPFGILEAVTAGPRARWWTAMEASQRHTRTVAEMEKVFPGIAKDVVAGASKCWDDDEWSRGDYCAFEPGEMRRFLPTLPKPEGRLHFAGEHTSALPGWMQGAFESGHRVAAEVHASS